MNIDIKLLKDLCNISSPSKEECAMITYILNYCYKIDNITLELDHYNNLFITKNTNNPSYYPCVIAHMDQIITHKRTYRVEILGDLIRGRHKNDKSSCGLGLDDKVGICIALQLLNYFEDLKVIFTTEEEIGALGAQEASNNIYFLGDVQYFLQADRRGDGDFIVNSNGIEIASKEFLKDVRPLMDSYKYRPAYGTFTDVGELCYETKIAGCNISCGYYKNHSKHEYGILSHMTKCLNFMKDIIINLPKDKVYNLPTIRKYNDYKSYYKNYDPDPYNMYTQGGDDQDALPCDTCKTWDCMHCTLMNDY